MSEIKSGLNLIFEPGTDVQLLVIFYVFFAIEVIYRSYKKISISRHFFNPKLNVILIFSCVFLLHHASICPFVFSVGILTHFDADIARSAFGSFVKFLEIADGEQLQEKPNYGYISPAEYSCHQHCK